MFVTIAMRDIIKLIILKWNSPWRCNNAFAYFLWLFGGLFGLHHFYLKRDAHAFVTFSTGGGCFGIGFLYDFFHIPYYVRLENKLRFDSKDQFDFTDPVKQPKFKLSRILYQSLFGSYVGILFLALFSRKTYDDYTTLITLTNSTAIALGVNTVASIGKIRCSFVNCLFGPLAVNAFVFLEIINEPDVIVVHSAFASSMLAFLTRGWRYAQPSDVKSRSIFVRFILVYGAAFILNVLLLNTPHIKIMRVNEPTQEDIVRITWKNIIKQSKLIYRELKNLLDEFNFNFSNIPDGTDETSQAFRILQLSKYATSREITSQYRKMAKKWHPDKHFGDSEKKRQANSSC